MKLIEKITALAIVLGVSFLPSLANIQGNISTENFYDTDRTIMTKNLLNNNIRSEKYWQKNLLHFSKYRPFFMLSNKELYNLMPREHVSVSQRIAAPSVYNISLKTASIKVVSLSDKTQQRKKYEPKKTTNINKSNIELISKYTCAKNSQVDSGEKIETVLALKKSKIVSNYNLAINLLDEVTKKEPYNAYAFYLKGELYSEKKDAENAMKNYIEALKINPLSKQCCLGIAKILEPKNKSLAQKYYERAK